jgi:hypothetical protein
VLQRLWPTSGRVLEIASGTGEHAVHFAKHMPHLVWQPSDLDADAIASITAWREHVTLPNLEAPVVLDVCAQPWPGGAPTGIFCANMIHIAPWEAALGLLAGAGRVLGPDDPLVLYGPFREGGAHTAPSNEAFDQSLRSRDPRWGVRDVDAVAEAAAEHGLALDEVVVMPANNRIVVLRR